MRPFYRSRILVACFHCSVVIASAQQTQSTTPVAVVPRLIRFVGSFHPPLSQPAGMIGATFAIYGQPEGGTPLWSEDQNVEPDANGNYAVLLGLTKNGGVPSELFAASEARWLQVRFYVPGEVDLPRVLLVSVPYALKAADADTLGGLPASAFAQVSALPTASAPNIIAAASLSPKEVAHLANAPATACTGLTSDGTGAANKIAKFTAPCNVEPSSAIFESGGKVGIGTSAPVNPLGVQGSDSNTALANVTAMASFANTNTINNNFVLLAFRSNDTASTQTAVGKIGAQVTSHAAHAMNADLVFGPSTAGTVNEAMRITSARNVGIGTTVPAAKLEVNGNAQVDGNFTLSGSILLTGVGPMIQVPNNGSGNFSAGLGTQPPTTTGIQNTAVGNGALQVNTGGGENTAVGYQTLFTCANGTQFFACSNNTAVGWEALYSGDGWDNTAVGSGALINNSSIDNTAVGRGALGSNTSGDVNTALGWGALSNSITGSDNIAIGYAAGINVTNTSNNIHVGNQGTATDSGTIRIGTPGGQTSAFVAGISNVNVSGVPVVVNSSGQLGVASSSRRYKEDIQDMGDASTGLLQLRPVTFRYKKPFNDWSKPIQYGLIAEEVAEVYPDLVARSADGQIETVKYQLLDSMLLNELQKQNATITAQKEQIRSLEERLARVEAVLSGTAVTASSR